jgi:hypothetical protein
MDSTGDREEISPSHPGEAVEYFFASDASAIIEHTNRVIFLEDDDVASVSKGNSIRLFLLVTTSIKKLKVESPFLTVLGTVIVYLKM